VISGVIGIFSESHLVVEACHRLRERRFRRLETYGPYAVPELDDALGIQRTMLRWVVLALGLSGVAIAYFVLWWTNAIDYPYLVGGRPFNSVPADVPIMFETGVLFAGVAGFVGAFLASGMPRLYTPVIDVPGFDRTSVDRFWIVIPFTDPAWSSEVVGELRELGAIDVRLVGEVPQ
jgi:hypothetical protein